MKIIISPAKKMNCRTDFMPCSGTPVLLARTQELLERVRQLTYNEAKAVWKCNDKIAELNYRRFQEMDLAQGMTPALLAYEGIQYQYMSPQVFEAREWEYVQEHLRILSGFYGILKPLDKVTPYRLEMQARMKIGDKKQLYDFWGSQIYDELAKEESCVINLASKEYSLCIENYLSPEIRYITCIFGEDSNGKILQKGTQAKMARGEMVRFLVETGAGEPEKMKEFRRLEYTYREDLSSGEKYVFLKGDRKKNVEDW